MPSPPNVRLPSFSQPDSGGNINPFFALAELVGQTGAAQGQAEASSARKAQRDTELAQFLGNIQKRQLANEMLTSSVTSTMKVFDAAHDSGGIVAMYNARSMLNRDIIGLGNVGRADQAKNFATKQTGLADNPVLLNMVNSAVDQSNKPIHRFVDPSNPTKTVDGKEVPNYLYGPDPITTAQALMFAQNHQKGREQLVANAISTQTEGSLLELTYRDPENWFYDKETKTLYGREGVEVARAMAGEMAQFVAQTSSRLPASERPAADAAMAKRLENKARAAFATIQQNEPRDTAFAKYGVSPGGDLEKRITLNEGYEHLSAMQQFAAQQTAAPGGPDLSPGEKLAYESSVVQNFIGLGSFATLALQEAQAELQRNPSDTGTLLPESLRSIASRTQTLRSKLDAMEKATITQGSSFAVSRLRNHVLQPGMDLSTSSRLVDGFNRMGPETVGAGMQLLEQSGGGIEHLLANDPTFNPARFAQAATARAGMNTIGAGDLFDVTGPPAVGYYNNLIDTHASLSESKAAAPRKAAALRFLVEHGGSTGEGGLPSLSGGALGGAAGFIASSPDVDFSSVQKVTSLVNLYSRQIGDNGEVAHALMSIPANPVFRNLQLFISEVGPQPSITRSSSTPVPLDPNRFPEDEEDSEDLLGSQARTGREAESIRSDSSAVERSKNIAQHTRDYSARAGKVAAVFSGVQPHNWLKVLDGMVEGKHITPEMSTALRTTLLSNAQKGLELQESVRQAHKLRELKSLKGVPTSAEGLSRGFTTEVVNQGRTQRVRTRLTDSSLVVRTLLDENNVEVGVLSSVPIDEAIAIAEEAVNIFDSDIREGRMFVQDRESLNEFPEGLTDEIRSTFTDERVALFGVNGGWEADKEADPKLAAFIESQHKISEAEVIRLVADHVDLPLTEVLSGALNRLTAGTPSEQDKQLDSSNVLENAKQALRHHLVELAATHSSLDLSGGAFSSGDEIVEAALDSLMLNVRRNHNGRVLHERFIATKAARAGERAPEFPRASASKASSEDIRFLFEDATADIFGPDI